MTKVLEGRVIRDWRNRGKIRAYIEYLKSFSFIQHFVICESIAVGITKMTHVHFYETGSGFVIFTFIRRISTHFFPLLFKLKLEGYEY